MTKMMNYILFGLLLCTLSIAKAQTINAASCNTSDVQTAINTATEGQTVSIPAGTCSWTTGVTISGKGINVIGAGTSRIIAVSSTTLALGTGVKTLTVTGADPGNALSISAGQTLTITETGTATNTMTGTVTSYTSSTGSLVMNITSASGACGSNSLSNCGRWLVINNPASMTQIVNNNATDTPLFAITEDTSFHTNISNIFVSPGSGLAHVYFINYVSGGVAVVIHDCRVSENPNSTEPPSGDASMVEFQGNRGLIYNCSFDSSPYNPSTLFAVSIKDGENLGKNSWTSASNMGILDTTGQAEVFLEDNDYHAMGFATNNDDNGRMVSRYSLYDNSGMMGTHGADTSMYGQRYFESYNNVAVFNGYSNGTTFNINDWFYVRGGTFVIYNNTIPAFSSQDYGSKPDVNMTVMNLQRNGGPDPCWGGSFTSVGPYHQAPRQVGFGYVTGAGTANYPTGGVTNSSNDSVTYVGDPEPGYIWGNSRSSLNVQTTDYGGTGCTNPDSSTYYIVANRDYYNGTAKPGWAPYTYPHPLRSSSQTTAPTPGTPVNVQGVVQTTTQSTTQTTTKPATKPATQPTTQPAAPNTPK
jgi:hypothetical protein